MSNDIKEAIEVLEKLKEVLKYQYDYFKHMTTLNAGSILIIIALLEGIFEDPKCIGIVLISIGSFVLSLICSLMMMPMTTNIVLYITSMYSNYIAGDVEGIKEVSDKAKSSVNKIKVVDWFNSILFLLGITMLAVFAFINFL